jgi:hypothetical protein
MLSDRTGNCANFRQDYRLRDFGLGDTARHTRLGSPTCLCQLEIGSSLLKTLERRRVSVCRFGFVQVGFTTGTIAFATFSAFSQQ